MLHATQLIGHAARLLYLSPVFLRSSIFVNNAASDVVELKKVKKNGFTTDSRQCQTSMLARVGSRFPGFTASAAAAAPAVCSALSTLRNNISPRMYQVSL